MGDEILPNVTPKQMRQFSNHLPRFMWTIGETALPYNQALFNARAAVEPQELAFDESLMSYFGPRYAQIGSEIQRQNAFNNAITDLGVLTGPGAGLVAAGKDLDQFQDPEYYGLRRASADKFLDLLGGQDPNKLTGSEMANVERSVNRVNQSRGLSNAPSNINTVSNAMMFGQELDRKRNTLLNSLNAVPSNLAAMKSGTDVFQVATGRPSQGANPGSAQFGTQRGNFGNNVSNSAGGLLGEIGSNARQNQSLEANKRDALDRGVQVGQTIGSFD